jgi:hypothetical protein
MDFVYLRSGQFVASECAAVLQAFCPRVARHEKSIR